MLRIEPAPTFNGKVLITTPGGEPGVLDITWRHMGVRALADWWDLVRDKPVVDALCEVIESVSGLHDKDGRPVPHSPEALRQLLDAYHAAGGELLAAYFEQLTAAREKNSGARPVP